MQVEEQQSKWTDFSDEITEVVLEELTPSPFNARVIRLDDAKLLELVESIRKNGVHQPIIIREIPIEGEVVDLQIICGHRRVEASKLAGCTTIPAITRDLNDEEAQELQITENLQREDLPPLEEAIAFNEALAMNPLKVLSVQELAARLGKSPVYIHRRLALLDLVAPGKQALQAGRIDVGHALEIARLMDDEQTRLLAWLGVGESIEDEDRDDWSEHNSDEDDDDTTQEVGHIVSVAAATTKSVVELRNYIGRTALRVLGNAPFDPNDPDLWPEGGSCADCLKRTGGSPQLFNDVMGDDVCTDRSCYDAKVRSYIDNRFEEARASKRELHRLTTNYGTKGANTHYVYHGLTEVKEPCESTVEAIYIDGDKTGKSIQICVGSGCKVHKSGNRSSSSTPDPKAKEKRKALLAKVKLEKDYRLRLFKELLAKPIDPIPTNDMVHRLVAFAFTRIDNTKHQILADTLGWHKDSFGWMGGGKTIARLMTHTQGDLIRIALVALEANELTVHEFDRAVTATPKERAKQEIGLEEMAKLFGVDAAKIRAGVETPATPPAVPKKGESQIAFRKRKLAEAPAEATPAKKAPAKKAAKKGGKS